jgi:hypothetical protein
MRISLISISGGLAGCFFYPLSKKSISGGFLPRDNIQQRALMIFYFREQSPLNLLREYGNPGHPPNANFSCG